MTLKGFDTAASPPLFHERSPLSTPGGKVEEKAGKTKTKTKWYYEKSPLSTRGGKVEEDAGKNNIQTEELHPSASSLIFLLLINHQVSVKADYCLVLTLLSCGSMIFLKTNAFFSCLGRLWTGWWSLTRRPFCSCSSLLLPSGLISYMASTYRSRPKHETQHLRNVVTDMSMFWWHGEKCLSTVQKLLQEKEGSGIWGLWVFCQQIQRGSKVQRCWYNSSASSVLVDRPQTMHCMSLGQYCECHIKRGCVTRPYLCPLCQATCAWIQIQFPVLLKRVNFWKFLCCNPTSRIRNSCTLSSPCHKKCPFSSAKK